MLNPSSRRLLPMTNMMLRGPSGSPMALYCEIIPQIAKRANGHGGELEIIGTGHADRSGFETDFTRCDHGREHLLFVSLRLRWFSISKSEDAAVCDNFPS